MKLQRVFALLLCAALLLCGCSNGGKEETQITAVEITPDPAYIGKDGVFEYPMEPVTLSINLDPVDRSTIPAWALEYYIWDIIAEKTGVTLERIGSSGQGGGNNDAIYTLIASGDLPDIFLNNWFAYSDGPEDAIKHNIILRLNEIYSMYAPNLTKVLEENEKWAKDTATDDGTYYVFPFLRSSGGQCSYGLAYRKDKLDEFDLEVPETPGELENVLRVLKQNGEGCGLTFEYRYLFTGEQGYGTALQSGFGIKSGFYIENGAVHFGECEPAYEEFVSWLNKLYLEGLIDPEMPSVDKTIVQNKFRNGDALAVLMGPAQSVAEVSVFGEGWEIAGGPSLTPEKGTAPKFGHMENSYTGASCAAISTDCENIAAAARFLDWFYAQDNLELYQRGVEGFAYAVVDGEYTRDIDHLIPLEGENADSVSMRMRYAQISGNWPMKMLEGMNSSPDAASPQEKISAAWSNNLMAEHIMPPITLTRDESSDYITLFMDIDTYMREQIALFITGVRPMSEFADFTQMLEKLGVQQLISIQQSAYDRYLAR